MTRNMWAVLIAVAAAGCGSKTSPPTVPGPALGGPEDPPGADAPAAPVAVAQGNPRSDLIPRQVLFGNPERAGVQISPDGKWLSWLAESQGVLNVWVAPIGKLDEARAVTADTTRPVYRYFWAFDGKHLLYLQDKAGDENWRLHAVDVATGTVRELVAVDGARVDVYAVPHRKPGQILVGINDRNPQVFDVHRVDLKSGARTLVVQNDQAFIGYQFDRDSNVRFAYRMQPDGSMAIDVHDPKNKKAPWKPYDTVGSEDVMTTGMLAFDKKGTAYYAYDSRGRDTAGLFRVDARSKKKTLVHEDPRVDVTRAMFHPTEGTLQAVATHYDRPRWVPIDKKVARDLEGIGKLSDGFPYVTSRTLDDKVWIVAFDSDRRSTHYYRWDRAGHKGELLFSSRPALDEQPLSPMHPVVIPSRDGLSMVSYLTLPLDADADGDGKADRPVPMVLYVHGGPWHRDEWGFEPVHQMLANRGYAVLSVNYRGSTGFGKKFINAANRQWGKQMHDDLLDAVAWAVAEGVAPRERICIMGGSYGGYATLVGLSMTPDVFACGVDLVGVSNLITFLETIPPYWAPMMALLHERVGDPTTPEGRQALVDVSPVTHAGQIKRPLFIAQGANDPRVVKAESDQIVQAMQAKQIPVSYVVFPDEGHGFARPENNIAFFALTEAFLSVHLGGFFQPITDAELRASSMQIEAGREWLPGLPEAGKAVSQR
jgi:dipeptidyl aminopeptidase/acylaminoacyl peptidase